MSKTTADQIKEHKENCQELQNQKHEETQRQLESLGATLNRIELKIDNIAKETIDQGKELVEHREQLKTLFNEPKKNIAVIAVIIAGLSLIASVTLSLILR